MPTNVVGSLVVKLMAQTAEFQQGLQEAVGATSAFGKTAEQVASPLEQLRNVMQQVGKGFGTDPLGATLKTLSSSTTWGVTGATALGAAIAGVAKNMNNLVINAERLGVGVEYFQQMQVAAERTGVDMGTMESALSHMRKLVSGAGIGEKEPARALSDIGLTITDLQGLSIEGTFERIGKAIAAIPDPMKRARVEIELFGRSGAQLDSLIRKGGVIELGGLVVTGDVVKSAAEMGSKLAVVWHGVTWAVKETLGTVAGLANEIINIIGAVATLGTWKPESWKPKERIPGWGPEREAARAAEHAAANEERRQAFAPTFDTYYEGLRDRARGYEESLKEVPPIAREIAAIERYQNANWQNITESQREALKELIARLKVTQQLTEAERERRELAKASQEEFDQATRVAHAQAAHTQQVIESLDPLERLKAELGRMPEGLTPEQQEKYIARARQQAVSALGAGAPQLQPISGPAKYSQEAFKTIADIQMGRVNEQLKVSQEQLEELKGVREDIRNQKLQGPAVAAPP